MTTTLLLLDEWRRTMGDEPVSFERLALFDVGARYPRHAARIVPGLGRVLRANGMAEEDLTDLFAKRNFDVSRQRLQATLLGLLVRDLVAEITILDIPGGAFRITERGGATADAFSSRLSWALRSIFAELVQAWGRASTDRIEDQLRNSIPMMATEIAALRRPFDVEGVS